MVSLFLEGVANHHRHKCSCGHASKNDGYGSGDCEKILKSRIFYGSSDSREKSSPFSNNNTN